MCGKIDGDDDNNKYDADVDVDDIDINDDGNGDDDDHYDYDDDDDRACTVWEEGGWRLGSCSRRLALLGRPRRQFQVIIILNYNHK